MHEMMSPSKVVQKWGVTEAPHWRTNDKEQPIFAKKPGEITHCTNNDRRLKTWD